MQLSLRCALPSIQTQRQQIAMPLVERSLRTGYAYAKTVCLLVAAQCLC
ncbi:MAG: hypothetical protein V7K20_13690 [Nostoc sp.]